MIELISDDEIKSHKLYLFDKLSGFLEPSSLLFFNIETEVMYRVFFLFPFSVIPFLEKVNKSQISSNKPFFRFARVLYADETNTSESSIVSVKYIEIPFSELKLNVLSKELIENPKWIVAQVKNGESVYSVVRRLISET